MFEGQMIALLRGLHYKTDFLHAQLVNIQRELKMVDDKLSVLEADIADTDTVVGSIETLVTNLVAELTLAKGDDDRIQAVIDKLDANKSRLAALVTANTPADPGTPVPPPVEPTP